MDGAWAPFSHSDDRLDLRDGDRLSDPEALLFYDSIDAARFSIGRLFGFGLGVERAV